MYGGRKRAGNLGGNSGYLYIRLQSLQGIKRAYIPGCHLAQWKMAGGEEEAYVFGLILQAILQGN